MSRRTLAGPDVSVVILNWNGARRLPRCLSALASQTYSRFELWLVDNGSTDGSAALLDDVAASATPRWLEGELPGPAKVIRNKRNLGFAAGNNQAIGAATTEYIVTLNDDAVPGESWLEELISTAAAVPGSAGMVASTMVFAHAPDIVASAGISLHRDGSALDRAMGMKSDALLAMGTRPVFGPSAGAALYKRRMLRDVGLFDERFFSYLEDADLAWRARSRGWRALHNPRALVAHDYSASGGHASPFKSRLIARNRIWAIYKNLPQSLWVRLWAQIAGYEAAALLRGLAAEDHASVAGRLEALRRLPEFQFARRVNLCRARLHPDEQAALLAPALTFRQARKYRRRLDRILSTRQPRSARVPGSGLSITRNPERETRNAEPCRRN